MTAATGWMLYKLSQIVAAVALITLVVTGWHSTNPLAAALFGYVIAGLVVSVCRALEGKR